VSASLLCHLGYISTTLLNVLGFTQIGCTTTVAAAPTSEFVPSAISLTVPVPLAGSLSDTLRGSSHPISAVATASPQRPCVSENHVNQVPISTQVVTLAEHWLTLHMGSQDTRVSRCPLGVLETHVTSLCELSKRQVPAYLTRSSDAMAGKIGEIFRATMRVIVGRATARAQAYVLPFAVDSSSPYLHTVDQFKAHLEDLFGPEIYRSLTDPSYRDHWNHIESRRPRVSNTGAVKLTHVCAVPSNSPSTRICNDQSPCITNAQLPCTRNARLPRIRNDQLAPIRDA
jgi:hypothetical protein